MMISLILLLLVPILVHHICTCSHVYAVDVVTHTNDSTTDTPQLPTPSTTSSSYALYTLNTPSHHHNNDNVLQHQWYLINSNESIKTIATIPSNIYTNLHSAG